MSAVERDSRGSAERMNEWNDQTRSEAARSAYMLRLYAWSLQPSPCHLPPSLAVLYSRVRLAHTHTHNPPSGPIPPTGPWRPNAISLAATPICLPFSLFGLAEKGQWARGYTLSFPSPPSFFPSRLECLYPLSPSTPHAVTAPEVLPLPPPSPFRSPSVPPSFLTSFSFTPARRGFSLPLPPSLNLPF